MKYATCMTALAVLAFSSQLGCKKLIATGARLMDAGVTETTTDTETADDDGTLNGLVDCINGLDHSISSSLERYTSWLPEGKENEPQPGPTGKERSVYGLYKIGDTDVASCNKGLAKASSSAEFKDIAAKYKARADALVPVMNEAYVYYDRKNYQDDKFAKGKELHTKLWPLAESFLETSHEFRKAVSKANDARMDAEIKEVEAKQGRNLAFQELNVMRQAKVAVRLGTEEKISLADFEPAVTAYEKAVEELRAYVGAHKDEVGKVMMWSIYESETEDFLKAIKGRLRRVRDKKPYSQTERMMLDSGASWTVEGSPAKVNHEYNELVSRSNGLRF